MNSQRITGYFKKITGYGFLLIIVLMTLSIIRNIGKITAIRKEVDAERQRIEKLKIENEELQKRISETQSDEFVERQIRDKLGLVKEGEIVMVLPDEEVLRSLAPKLDYEEDSLPDPNYIKWLKLFL